MFTESYFIHTVTFCFMLLLVPGPTNTLLLSSGLIAGFRRTRKLIGAELAGYLVAISCWGFVLMGLSHYYPWITNVLKLLAAGYVAWMAIKIWNIDQQSQHDGNIKFSNVFLTTLLNPKSFLFASYIMPAGTFSESALYIPVMLSFILALLPASVFWSSLGHYLGRKTQEKVNIKPNFLFRGASLVLSVFSLTMFYNILSVIK